MYYLLVALFLPSSQRDGDYCIYLCHLSFSPHIALKTYEKSILLFSVGHVNIRSLVNKIDDLKNLLKT